MGNHFQVVYQILNFIQFKMFFFSHNMIIRIQTGKPKVSYTGKGGDYQNKSCCYRLRRLLQKSRQFRTFRHGSGVTDISSQVIFIVVVLDP
jgi:hypothetical protein